MIPKLENAACFAVALDKAHYVIFPAKRDKTVFSGRQSSKTLLNSFQMAV
ncbi:MAG: hypothetical protein V7695_24840 [Sulfitobacter sp.]